MVNADYSRRSYSLERLLSGADDNDSDGDSAPDSTANMQRLTSHDSTEQKELSTMRDRYVDTPATNTGEASSLSAATASHDGRAAPSSHAAPEFKVYRRRWFGLLQLTLLNIVVSWDWLTFAPVSRTSAGFFDVSQGAINWLSTGFLFAFVAAAPATMWALNTGGPKRAIVVAAVLIFVGNWVRYAGARAGERGVFAVVLFGQVLIGLAQPFVLSAPTRYSDLWFTDRGRISATALASLANPFGGALGQLIDPFLATKASEVPNMVLYVAIISSVAAVPSFFIPAAPPSPPSHTSSLPKPPLNVATVRRLARNPSFHLLLAPFSVYVAAFNATSSLLNQILEPYGLSESDAGICGAILIVVGLVTAAITSPLVDRTKSFLTATRVLVPIIAAMYLAFIFAPPTRAVAAPYAVAAVLGAASFALVPVALEFLAETTYPVGPEMGSTLCWTGGQLLGAVFILVMGALKGGVAGEPAQTMTRALVFQAVVCWVVVPLPLCLGFFGTGRRYRYEADRAREVPGLDDGDPA